jgi:hypothetical protein
MHRIELWIFTTLFSVGVILGMTYLDMMAVDEPPATTVVEPKEVPNDLSVSEEFLATSPRLVPELSEAEIHHDAQLLTLGDRYMVAGNYSLALEKFRLYEKHIVGDRSVILLRKAFCHEQQNHIQLAEKIYRDAQTSARNKNHQLLASLGRSRCLLQRGKKRFALEQIADHLLTLDGDSSIASDAKAQLVFHFAKVLQSQAIFEKQAFENSKRDSLGKPLQQQDLLQPESVIFEEYQPNPETLLAALATPPAEPALSRRGETAIEIKQRSGDSATLISLSATAGIQPIMTLVQELAKAAEVNLQISPQAERRMAGRAHALALNAVSLASLLDQLLTPDNLAWYQTGKQINVIAKSEMQVTEESVDYWFDLAQRALRRFEIDFSENDRRNASLLARTNLSLLRGELNIAANLYQELEQIQAAGEMQAKIFFNQAKLNQRRQRINEANRLFYLAVDQTRDPNLESSSYCLLAQNLLAQSDLEGSITAGRRGISMAVTYPQKRVASLNLARAYLLNNDPFSANLILFKNREFFEESQHQPIASVLGAYARFMGVSDQDGIRIARNRLLTSISMLENQELLTSADFYVIAMAYQQLGFSDLAVQAMKQAIAKTDLQDWARKITFELAVVQYNRKQFQASVELLESLTDLDDQWKIKGLLQMAQMLNDRSDTDSCIKICKQVWSSDLTLGQRDVVLRLLGTSYQSKGEHHSAALCFAGMLPDRF